MYRLVLEYQARLLLKQNLCENPRQPLLISLLCFSSMRTQPPMMDSTFFSVELNCVPCLHMLHPVYKRRGCWVSQRWQAVALWWCGDIRVGGWMGAEGEEGLKVSTHPYSSRTFLVLTRLWLIQQDSSFQNLTFINISCI